MIFVAKRVIINEDGSSSEPVAVRVTASGAEMALAKVMGMWFDMNNQTELAAGQKYVVTVSLDDVQEPVPQPR